MPRPIRNTILTAPLAALLLNPAHALTEFTGGDLLDAANWTDGLPAGQQALMLENGYYSGQSWTSDWLLDSVVNIKRVRTYDFADDLIISPGADVTADAGTFNVTRHFLVNGGAIRFKNGTVTCAGSYEVADGGGTLTIFAGTHTCGSAFGARASTTTTNNNRAEMLGGSITAGTFRFGANSINRLGGNAVLQSASAASGIIMDGTIDVDDNWSGSWTMDGFSTGDWPNLVAQGGWSVGGEPVTAANFGDYFEESGGGTTLTLNSDVLITHNYTGFQEYTMIAQLEAFRDVIDGSSPGLTSDEWGTLRSYLNSNPGIIAEKYHALKAACETVETFDSVTNGGLWNGVQTGGWSRDSVTESRNWTMFALMTRIIEDCYTTANLERFTTLFENFRFRSAENFPGAVAEPDDPELTHTTTISASYLNTFGREANDGAYARKPTGTYLAPGSVATVTVPDSLVGRGLTVRVGSHSWDLGNKNNIERLDNVTTTFEITSTDTLVSNPLGGGIYIEVPYETDLGIADVTVKNFVRSAYYSAKSFHRTTLAEWQDTERHHPAPFADFQTDKVMLNLPRTWIYAWDNPQPALDQWDRYVDMCNDLMGFDRIRGRETVYSQIDLQIRGNAFSTGYPFSNSSFDPTRDYGGSYTGNYHLTADFSATTYNNSVFSHELGHSYYIPRFQMDGTESIINLLHVAYHNQLLDTGLGTALAYSAGPTSANKNADAARIAWMCSGTFLNNNDMKDSEAKYQHQGHAKTVDHARLFGWDDIERFYRQWNVDIENGLDYNRVVSRDEMLRRLCDASRTDIRPLYEVWSRKPADASAMNQYIMDNGYQPSPAIYDYLLESIDMVPDDNAEFQQRIKSWWQRTPQDPGDNSTEEYHAGIWNSYDESMAARIRARLQSIIDTYFPYGRPADGTLIRGGLACQSSNSTNGEAWLGHDGKVVGTNNSNSVQTEQQERAWWELDLGASYRIRDMRLFGRTGAAAPRLSNFDITLFDENHDPVWTRHVTDYPDPVEDFELNHQHAGRFVKIQLRDYNFLTFAELQLTGYLDPDANNCTATQSSTKSDRSASRAIDGITSPTEDDGGYSQTLNDGELWWELDLGKSLPVTEIKLFNREDEHAYRLEDYEVRVLDENRNVAWSTHEWTHPTPAIELETGGESGRYVQIQKNTDGPLLITEVQVAADVSSGTITPDPVVSYGAWITEQLQGSDLAPLLESALTTVTAPLHDADSDGMANLLEYLFGSNPALAEPSPLQTASDAGDFELTFPLRDDSGVSYRVSASSDLIHWSPDGITVETTTDPAPDGFTILNASLPATGEPTFLRIEASAP
ncbi:MAG: M60 family peptidase N-terminal accessory domain-containing protein [Verrucomicrobiota bacterium JB025]|nr:M60 family peptidase N-terminal accessory domain-containing protein [Verrucomicrobiota bacterium JB025]